MFVKPPILLIFSKRGEWLANRLKAHIEGATIHALEARASGDASFSHSRPHIQRLFTSGHPLIGLCAAGILIRTLAPCLRDKRSEPPVLSVAEDASAVVPLLGGHYGANDLARYIAKIIDVKPALTTSGDVHLDVALDAPPSGFFLINPAMAKGVMARLLDGETACLIGHAPWIENSQIPLTEQASLTLEITNKKRQGGEGHLVYAPKNLVLGIGSERGACANEAITLAKNVLSKGNFCPQSLVAIASIDLKADEAAIHAVADHFGVPAWFYDRNALEVLEAWLKNPSQVVKAEVGVAGVAEGAALAATGGRLVVEKQKGRGVTAALAELEQGSPLNPGKQRGRVFLVGIGPGSVSWRSKEAVDMLSQAQEWVGYGLYLDLIADLKTTQNEHRFKLGEEEKRVRHALELAGQTGCDVAIVCSGDPGIFAMATLAYELLDNGPRNGTLSAEAGRVEIVVSPGISAVQAAAARAGAPIGHDFCCVSLSDLLTPRADILKRLECAAKGDFVTALYNPRSKQRVTLLDDAFTLMRDYRPGTTPVILASNLGRKDESIQFFSLDTVKSDEVNMLTLVVVGSSQSKWFSAGDGRQWVYTPRGYTRIYTQKNTDFLIKSGPLQKA